MFFLMFFFFVLPKKRTKTANKRVQRMLAFFTEREQFIQKKGAFALRKRMLKIAIRGLRRLTLHAARASNNAAS